MIYEFQRAMQDVGLTIDNPIANGKIQRIPIVGKKGKPGWYAAKELNGRIFGSYGDWTTGEKYTFKNGGKGSSSLTKEELSVLHMISQNEREKQQLQAARRLIVAGIKVFHHHSFGLALGEVRT